MIIIWAYSILWRLTATGLGPRALAVSFPSPLQLLLGLLLFLHEVCDHFKIRFDKLSLSTHCASPLFNIKCRLPLCVERSLILELLHLSRSPFLIFERPASRNLIRRLILLSWCTAGHLELRETADDKFSSCRKRFCRILIRKNCIGWENNEQLLNAAKEGTKLLSLIK